MAKITTEEIEYEIEQLKNTEARAAVHFLRQELTRRRNAGRPATSGKTPKELNRVRQSNFRKRQRGAKG